MLQLNNHDQRYKENKNAFFQRIDTKYRLNIIHDTNYFTITAVFLRSYCIYSYIDGMIGP